MFNEARHFVNEHGCDVNVGKNWIYLNHDIMTNFLCELELPMDVHYRKESVQAMIFRIDAFWALSM